MSYILHSIVKILCDICNEQLCPKYVVILGEKENLYYHFV